MNETALLPAWGRDLRARVTAGWWTKFFGIPAFIAAFFTGYFILLKHAFHPVTLMPVTAIDRWIGFHGWALVPYVSLWIYVLLPPTFLRGRREIWVYTASVCAMALAGLAVFWRWPTTIPVAALRDGETGSALFLKTVDAAGNACPSLHVAFAAFTAIWVERLLRWAGGPRALRLGNAAWCVAIVYSTLATKQHVALDLLSGLALGVVCALPSAATDERRFGRPYSWLNRQTLGFAASFLSKATVFALGLQHHHPGLALVVFFGPDAWILTGLLIPNTRQLLPVARCFATARREVWLTIDDGPEPATTRPMLDVLDRFGAKATFFTIGRKAAAHPELVEEITRRGHTLGNHTATHPLAMFWAAGPGRTEREVSAWRASVPSTVAPTETAWFRPPAGIKSFFLRRVLARDGLIAIGWTARGRENLGPTIERPLRRLQRKIQPGAIVLVHECGRHGAPRIALLTGLLTHLERHGYTCVLPRPEQLRATFDAGDGSGMPHDSNANFVSSRASGTATHAPEPARPPSDHQRGGAPHAPAR